MGKSLSSQVRGVWAASGILATGGSRHAGKIAAREQLRSQGVGATSARIAALTPVTSYRTYDGYKAVSVDFANFAQALGVQRVQDLRPEHAEAYMLAKLAEGRACNTLRTYAAALAKFDRALDMASTRMRIPEEARLASGLEASRQRCNGQAPRVDTDRRAYADPNGLVDAIQGDGHQLSARLQFSAGFRVSEVMNLRRSDLRGLAVDPVTGIDCGLVHVIGKGGFERVQYVPASDYRALASHLNEHSGSMAVTYKLYLRALRQAADATGQGWGASHGLRHNYVRAFILDAARAGLSTDALMREAMERVGHHRVSELKTYLR